MRKNVSLDINKNLFTTALVSEQGESPLGVAVRKGDLDMIRWLVKECNANVNGESSNNLCSG